MQMLIGGKGEDSGEGTWIDVNDPATGEIIDRVPDGGKGDVGAAVDAAETAFQAWSEKTMRERGLLLVRAAGIVRERHGNLGALLTREQGKPIAEARDEVRGFANILEFYGGISSLPAGDVIRLGKQGDCITVREPLGVCGAIIPWNMPVLIMGWKTGPALLAGNTLVLKPSSSTPLTSLTLASIMEEAGVPPGVLNVVTGSGGKVGEALAAHPSIGKLSFTGSCETGRRVQQVAGTKEVTLELGGSDAMIVMEDADIGKAVEGAVRGRFYNAGQTCTAVKRLFVHEDIYGPFIKKMAERVQGVKVGNGLDPMVTMGPLHNRQQFERIAGLVLDVKELGQGNIVAGGSPSPGSAPEGKGFFFEPTVVTDVSPGSALLSEEVFGPVLPVMTCTDIGSAIASANRTRYGLGASVWTHNIAYVREVFDHVNAGVVWVNRHLTVPPEIPFGGTKESGTGRENGYRAVEGYTKTKTLFLGW
ncbi:MAG TPA: aldehyde dehydrogenase family protein [Methanoregulaceae archaeon]|nr:aldehyde dehydrogenase family protein [Methanoregulaceae archaeon]